MIGIKSSGHFFDQSEVKPKQIVTRSRTFFRASRQLHVFASSWITGLPVFFVIGQSYYFGLVLRHSVENCSNIILISLF